MKNITKVVLVVLFLYFSFIVTSRGQKQDKIEKIMENGVEVVINQIKPYKINGEPSNLHLELEFTINTEKDEIAEIGITDVLDFCVDYDGNIYFRIFRSTQDLIYKFDKKGNYLFSFGRRGQGPGELRSPKSLRENELGQIEISDSNRKICLFEKDGDLIKEISFSKRFLTANLLEKGKIIAMKMAFNREEGRSEYPIVLCNKELEDIKILHQGRFVPNLTLTKKINPLELYSDYYTYRISKGLIYLGNYGKGYEFLIYDTEGNLIRKIRKEYKKVEIPKQLKEEILSLAEKYNLKDVIKKVYFPEFYPPFQFFFLDEKGRLYVMTHERGKNPNSFIYDIFNPDGYFIARIELDNHGFSPNSYNELPLPLQVVSLNNRLYCLREKESGYKELVVYKMKWE
jgi:hypothetical protein